MTRSAEDDASRRGPKVPKDPEGTVPAELLPTPGATAADALSEWITENPHPNAGGIEIVRDQMSVLVYWKGTPPAALQELADRQAVPVTFKVADYSVDELIPIVKQLVSDNRDIVDSAGPSRDYSGISVTLRSKAPANALSQMRAKAGVPVVSDGVGDSVPLGDTGDRSAAGASSSRGRPRPGLS